MIHQVGEGTALKGGFPVEIIPKPDKFEKYAMQSLTVPLKAAKAAEAKAESLIGPSGPYQLLRNNCTLSACFPVLAAAGLKPPFWARTPSFLRLRFRWKGARLSKKAQ